MFKMFTCIEARAVVKFGATLQSYVPPMSAAAVFLRRMALAIDTAMQLSSATAAAAAAAAGGGGGGAGPGPGGGGRRKQHVQNLLLVRARPMYGFYPEDKVFIKVIL